MEKDIKNIVNIASYMNYEAWKTNATTLNKGRVEAERRRVAQEESKRSEDRNVEKIVAQLKKAIERLNVELKLDVDRESNTVVVKVLDPETKKIIRQIPEEELLEIRKRMKELIGVLYDRES